MTNRTQALTGRAVAAAAAAALLLTGCGGAADAEAETDPAASTGGETTELTMGVAASLTSIPVYLAQSEGFFADEGLEVELETLQSGSATIPQLLNGQLDVSIADTVATISAVANDVPLQIISTDVVGAPTGEEDFVGVVSGTVTDPEGMAGQTLAVNQLKGLAELLSRATLDEAGVDPDSVEFVEVAPPDMVAAVEQGRVAAAYLLEPFLSQGLAAGLDPVFTIADVAADLPIVTFSTTRQFAEQNPDVVERFNRAISRATAFAQENPEAARAAAASYTTLPPEVLEQIRIPTFATDATDTSGVGELADLMVTYGFLEEAPELDSYVGTP